MSVRIKRVILILPAVLFLAALVASALPTGLVYAATNITPRSLTLQQGAGGDGGSEPSGVVNHLFSFTLANAESVGSIMFQYCTTAQIDIGGPCTTPTGLSTTGGTVAIGTQTGTNFTSLNKTTNGSPFVYSASALSITANEAITVQLTNVVNPDDTNCSNHPNCTFFVHITTYALTNATGTPLDAGTVAAATSTQIVLHGTMPESLIFCTGQTISETNSIPDCTTATAGDIDFNQLFSPTDTAYATSQMAASTNAATGYAITVEGTTMKSGTNSVAAIGTIPAFSTVGTGQFGLNLANDTATSTLNPPLAPLSADATPIPNGTNFMGKAKTDFGTGGDALTAKYAYNAAGLNTVAASDNGTGTGGPTDSQIFTTTYIVNVSGSQPAGNYSTTLTYICTATY